MTEHQRLIMWQVIVTVEAVVLLMVVVWALMYQSGHPK